MKSDMGYNGYQLVHAFWEEHENIRIVNGSGSETCYIYASSNGIWDPNTEKAFQQRILQNDEYEWTTWGVGAKQIFVRDVLKEWYVNGISGKVDSIDKLIDLLREETKDCKEIVCVGSSAGGYLAIILGIELKASYVICNSGQINLIEIANGGGVSRTI